jgi:hypothetical protein
MPISQLVYYGLLSVTTFLSLSLLSSTFFPWIIIVNEIGPRSERDDHRATLEPKPRRVASEPY